MTQLARDVVIGVEKIDLFLGLVGDLRHGCEEVGPFRLESGIDRVTRTTRFPSLLDDGTQDQLQDVMKARPPHQGFANDLLDVAACS